MRGRKKRTLILGILCCLLVFMGVGFAVARTTLNIGGTSTAINTWSIVIDSITPIDNDTNATSVNVTIDEATKTNASFEVDFTKPGDFMEYTVVIKNNGSINGIINKVNATMDDPSNADNSLFKITSDVMPGISINAGESISFKVKIEFDENATRMPTSTVRFELSAEILQTEVGGNTPGVGGNTPEPDNDWLFEVDESGTVTAYNYNSTLTQTPQNVVVPAEVNGIPVTKLTEQSFMPKGNAEAYSTDSGMIIVIKDEANYEIIKAKFVDYFNLECESDDDTAEEISECKAMYETAMQYYRDSDPNIVIPEGAESMPVYMNPDSSVSLEDSLETEFEPNIKTLDLSNAINLTTIESRALSGAGLESIEFGDNSNITAIGNSAFSNNNLTSVEIPASVEMIEEDAFAQNQIENLTFKTTVNVKEQLAQNNKYALSKIGTNVKKVTIAGSNLKSIGNFAFRNNKINSLELPEGLEAIGAYAFANNLIAGELVIPEGVKTMGDYAFQKNDILNLTIPKTIETVGYSVFDSNPIETLTIGKCTTSLCSSNYFGKKIKNLTIESGEIGKDAFYSESSSTTKIENLTLGEGVTSIGESAFSNNLINGTLEISDNLKTIGAGAFYANQISGVILGNSITFIGYNAFQSNQINGEIILPSSLTELGYGAFSSNQISSVSFPATNISIDSFAFSGNLIEELYIPKNVDFSYNSTFKNNLIHTLTIGKCTASSCMGANTGSFAFDSTIVNLTIESGEIPEKAFLFSSGGTKVPIQNLILGNGVTSIGSKAFYCNSISGALVIPDSIEFIGDSAFAYNKISGNLIVSDNVKSIGSSAFIGNQISNLIIGKGVTNIGNYAFWTQLDSNNNGTLFTILIKRTEEDFLSNVTVGTKWYDTALKPTITYDPN